MYNVTLIENCTGCGACHNICPVGAIKMTFSRKGFYVPEVDMDKCTKCGKYKNVCPEIEFKSQNTEPEVYMAAAQDEDRDKSTSGGVFGVLADYVFENDGYVCGVAWNKKWEAEHIIINDKKDLGNLETAEALATVGGKSIKVRKPYIYTPFQFNKNKI